MQSVKNVYPPLPFANNKCYGNKLSVHGTRKMRGINEWWIRLIIGERFLPFSEVLGSSKLKLRMLFREKTCFCAKFCWWYNTAPTIQSIQQPRIINLWAIRENLHQEKILHYIGMYFLHFYTLLLHVAMQLSSQPYYSATSTHFILKMYQMLS